MFWKKQEQGSKVSSTSGSRAEGIPWVTAQPFVPAPEETESPQLGTRGVRAEAQTQMMPWSQE